MVGNPWQGVMFGLPHAAIWWGKTPVNGAANMRPYLRKSARCDKNAKKSDAKANIFGGNCRPASHRAPPATKSQEDDT
jgi:hypothetical protein